jgi:hypothetical protein
MLQQSNLVSLLIQTYNHVNFSILALFIGVIRSCRLPSSEVYIPMLQSVVLFHISVEKNLCHFPSYTQSPLGLNQNIVCGPFPTQQLDL